MCKVCQKCKAELRNDTYGSVCEDCYAERMNDLGTNHLTFVNQQVIVQRGERRQKIAKIIGEE